MSRPSRDPGVKAQHDWRKLHLRRDADAAVIAHQRVLLDELRRESIAIRIGGRLTKLEHFHIHIGVAKVLDSEGRVDGVKLELLLADHLREYPEHAARASADVGGAVVD